MTKIEVTDQLVERFCEAAAPYLELFKPPCGALISEDAVRAWKKEVARGILEKTLNPPPPEPDITVTEEQLQAAWGFCRGQDASTAERLKNIYRAMRKLEKPLCYNTGDGICHSERRKRASTPCVVPGGRDTYFIHPADGFPAYDRRASTSTGATRQKAREAQ